MNFPYTASIQEEPRTGDFLIIRRPEIPVTISGPNGSATFVGLVDTGSDNTIFPKSIAESLGIKLEPGVGLPARSFGGHEIILLFGQVRIYVEDDVESCEWQAIVCFHDSQSSQDSVILGHDGFLEFFTATFDGAAELLTLKSNAALPQSA